MFLQQFGYVWHATFDSFHGPIVARRAGHMRGSVIPARYRRWRLGMSLSPGPRHHVSALHFPIRSPFSNPADASLFAKRGTS
jgi:hypothetical protein